MDDKGEHTAAYNPQGSAPGGRNGELAFFRRYTRALYDAGVAIVPGSDSLTVLLVSGFSMRDVLHNLEMAGLTRTQVLEAATLNTGLFIEETLPNEAPSVR